MDYTIGPLEADDLDDLVPLFDDYRHSYGMDRDPEGARSFLSERLANDESVVLLARDAGGRGAGFAQLYPTYSSVSMIRAWLLNDLFVAADHRRRGLGRRLMEAVVDHARATGRRRVELETAVDNMPARTLYEQMGFARSEGFHTYRIEL